MIHLPDTLKALGTPDFKNVVKREVEQLEMNLLPLQQGLAVSSHVSDRPIQAMILSTNEEGPRILVKAGLFYTGVIAGCNCADDPSPVDELNEYCVVRFEIDKRTAETTVILLEE